MKWRTCRCVCFGKRQVTSQRDNPERLQDRLLVQTDVTSIEYFTSTFQVRAARHFTLALFYPSTQQSVRSERCICAGCKARTPAAAGTKTLCGGELKDVAFISSFAAAFCRSPLIRHKRICIPVLRESSSGSGFSEPCLHGTLRALCLEVPTPCKELANTTGRKADGADFLNQKYENKMSMDADGCRWMPMPFPPTSQVTSLCLMCRSTLPG